MILRLDNKHKGFKVYKVYENDVLGLTVTYFIERSNLVAYVFELGPLN